MTSTFNMKNLTFISSEKKLTFIISSEKKRQNYFLKGHSSSGSALSNKMAYLVRLLST